MTRRSFRLSRRGFAAMLLRGAALWSGRALAGDPSVDADRGLGGTGAAPLDPAETLGQDRGIGGTGVVGTIRRFGSVVVNDLRVAFPPDVAVTIDGRRASPRDLRIGHVVHVLARHRGATLSTRAIAVLSEVVGPVDAAGQGHLTVLGQRVAVPQGVAVPGHAAGDHVAVSGLRRLDGAIVASLVEHRPAGPARLHGPVRATAGGGLAVGGLAVAGLDPALLGRRVALVGERRGAVFHPSEVVVEPRVPFATADRLSLEAYVARVPDGLELGSGIDVTADAAALADVDREGAVRAVVLGRPGPEGRIEAESVRVEHGNGRMGRAGAGPAPAGAPSTSAPSAAPARGGAADAGGKGDGTGKGGDGSAGGGHGGGRSGK